jgi:predicted Rossmann fold nucleotide-binding protein DprA/Smf involved in DNA uptake
MDNGAPSSAQQLAETLESHRACIAELQEAATLQRKRLEDLERYARALSKGLALATARFIATGDKQGAEKIKTAMFDLLKPGR